MGTAAIIASVAAGVATVFSAIFGRRFWTSRKERLSSKQRKE